MAMRNEIINAFETAQCTIIIIDTGLEAFDEHIYACISIHKCDGKMNIRFGNKIQLDGMINSYVPLKRFTIDEKEN